MSKDPELQAHFDACKGRYSGLTATQRGIADSVVGLEGNRFLFRDLLKVLPPAPECPDELLSKHPEIANLSGSLRRLAHKRHVRQHHWRLLP